MSNDIRAVCVIGWPVEHSRSPLIHNFWIGQHALAGEYRREAVTPEEFPAFVKELAAARLCRRQCHDPAQGSGDDAVGAG